MDQSDTTQCLNCKAEVVSKYCPECGQKRSIGKITGKTILTELLKRIFNFEKGYWYTLKKLIIRPADCVMQYLEGKRVKLVKPMQFLFVLTAATALLRVICYTLAEQAYGIRFIANADLSNNGFDQFFHKYPALMFCSFIPFLTLTGWLGSRRTARSMLNYWEILIFNLYTTAVFNVFYLLYVLTITAIPDFHPKLTFMLVSFCIWYANGLIDFLALRTGKRPVLLIFVVVLAVVLIYLTGLSLTGFMSPWWQGIF